MKINGRRRAKENYDPSSVDSNSYNDAAGAKKIIPVGPKLKPIISTSTDASSRVKIGKGKAIAIFANGVGEVTRFICEADVADSLDGDHILISSPTVDYYIWFNTPAGGGDPLVVGRVGIEITIATGATAIVVADAIRTEIIANYPNVFLVDAAGSATINFTSIVTGAANAAPTIGTTGWGAAAAVITVGSVAGPAGVVRVGGATVVSGPAGTVDGDGNVSIPCRPGDWTYINTYDQEFIITNSPTVLCFLIEDDTFIDYRGV